MGEKKVSLRRIKQNVIGKHHCFFAIVQPGFEDTAKQELMDLGINEFLNVSPGGIEFKAKLNLCYKINLCTRTVSRLLMRLTSFRALYFNVLKNKTKEFPWELYLKNDARVVFNVTSKKSKLYHTDRITEECYAGIQSRLKEYGQTIHVLKKDNESAQKIMVRLQGDKCSLSLDTSGDFLYKRGQRVHVTKAPLRETLAALILREAGWPKYDTLLDPMCGSGVFSIEGANMAFGHLANGEREFPFMNWPGFKPAAFSYLKKKLLQDISEHKKTILASDTDPDAVKAARDNISMANLEQAIKISTKDLFKGSSLKTKTPLLVLNPPYGKRMNKKQMEKLYRQIGNTLRRNYKGAYAVIVPGLAYEKVLSLTYDKKILFRNGGIKVSVLFKY